MMKSSKYCCHVMEYQLNDPRMPVEYSPIVREYNITLLRPSQAVQGLIFCPWCGTKLPKSLRDELFEILENEYNIEPDLDITNAKNVPEEFKSDAWWKKRKL